MDGWLFVEIPHITKRCRACGADVPVGLKFCTICGQQLSVTRLSPPPPRTYA
jgi:rRNA maturation endonuclease Nob1